MQGVLLIIIWTQRINSSFKQVLNFVKLVSSNHKSESIIFKNSKFKALEILIGSWLEFLFSQFKFKSSCLELDLLILLNFILAFLKFHNIVIHLWENDFLKFWIRTNIKRLISFFVLNKQTCSRCNKKLNRFKVIFNCGKMKGSPSMTILMINELYRVWFRVKIFWIFKFSYYVKRKHINVRLSWNGGFMLMLWVLMSIGVSGKSSWIYGVFKIMRSNNFSLRVNHICWKFT